LGTVTILANGSILIENADLNNISIMNCDLHAESGEYPIPFADRMNQLEDFAAGSAKYPGETLHAGHTHSFNHEGTDKCICGQVDNSDEAILRRTFAKHTHRCSKCNRTTAQFTETCPVCDGVMVVIDRQM